MVRPAEKNRLPIRLDEDIIEHVGREEGGDQSRMSAVREADVLARQANETGEEGE